MREWALGWAGALLTGACPLEKVPSAKHLKLVVFLAGKFVVVLHWFCLLASFERQSDVRFSAGCLSGRWSDR